jgi:hypothetical protein
MSETTIMIKFPKVTMVFYINFFWVFNYNSQQYYLKIYGGLNYLASESRFHAWATFWVEISDAHHIFNLEPLRQLVWCISAVCLCLGAGRGWHCSFDPQVACIMPRRQLHFAAQWRIKRKEMDSQQFVRCTHIINVLCIKSHRPVYLRVGA